jgi:sodium/pantothenate symporter
MDLFALTIGASLLIYILVGIYAGRSVRQLDDYFVAGRRAPTLLILGTLVASVMSTAIFMGEAAFTYQGQLGTYILFPGIAVTGYLLGALFFGVFIRRSRAPTVADYFGQRFDSRKLQQFAGFTIIFGLSGYLVIVTYGASLLLADLTGLSFVTSLLVAWFSYTLFTLYAGSKGVILTDTLMFLLFMTATVFFVFYIVDGLGGLKTAVTDITHLESKRGIASWTGIIGVDTEWPTAVDFVIWVLVMEVAWALVYAVGPWQAGRHLMARDEHVVLRAAILATFCVIVLQMLVYGAGGLMNLANDRIEPPETVLIWAAQFVVPEMLGALMLAGIIAAGLSSASTFLSLVGFSVSNDIGPRPIALDVSMTRKIMLVTSVAALVCTWFFPPDIFFFMMFIATVFGSSWGPVGLMSVWSRRITKEAAFWGMVTGFFLNVVPATLDHVGLIALPEYGPAVIGTLSSLAVILLLSARGEVTPAEREYREQLHRTPAADVSRRKTLNTLLAPIGLLVYGCVIPWVLLEYYVIPYQVGTGEILPGGAVNWSTGEALLALSATFVHVPLALLAMFVIWRRYHPASRANRG